MSERRIEYVPLADVVPAETNPKLHAEGDLLDSLAEHGYGEPVLLDERTGRFVAGHGRLEALLTLHAAGRPVPDGIIVDESGGWSVPVVRGWSSRDDAQAARYLIAANRLTEKGGWDSAALADMLADLERTDTLVGTGYGSDDLAELLAGLAPVVESPAPLSDPDDVPAAPADPVTVRGDVWLLGPHRLMCGDCRDADDVAVLLLDDRVNVAFTSPPYAEQRGYDPTSGFVPIHPDDYVEWFAPVAALVAAHLADDGSWFVNIKAAADGLDTHLYVLDLVSAHVRHWGWHYATEFCWERGDVVYDPFVGSGSTILAADQTGRAGRGMELSPGYCDVAARRYQRHTGIKPIRESTGELVDFG